MLGLDLGNVFEGLFGAKIQTASASVGTFFSQTLLIPMKTKARMTNNPAYSYIPLPDFSHKSGPLSKWQQPRDVEQMEIAADQMSRIHLQKTSSCEMRTHRPTTSGDQVSHPTAATSCSDQSWWWGQGNSNFNRTRGTNRDDHSRFPSPTTPKCDLVEKFLWRWLKLSRILFLFYFFLIVVCLGFFACFTIVQCGCYTWSRGWPLSHPQLSGGVIMGIGIFLLASDTVEKSLSTLIDMSVPIEFVSTAASIMIGVGSFVFVIGFCGCCGAIRESAIMLSIVSLRWYYVVGT